ERIRSLDDSGAISIGDDVAGPVPAAPIGDRVDERWSVATSRALYRLGDDGSHRLDVLAIDGPSRNAIACGARGDRRWQITVVTLRNRPAVVLAHVDDGQAPACCKVDVLVEVTAIGGAVAEAADADAVGSLLLERERRARRGANGGPQVPGHPRHHTEMEWTIE